MCAGLTASNFQMHIPTPYSTSVTALYVNRNFIVSENRAIICLC